MTPSSPETVSPVSSVTLDLSMAAARELRRTEPSGRRSASCDARAPMPASGSALSPRARRLNTSSKSREDVSSAGSKNIPARNGRRNRSTMDGENPSFSRCRAVVVSGDERITSSGGRGAEPGEADEDLVGKCADRGEDGGDGAQRKAERVGQQVERLTGAKEDERPRVERPETQRREVKEAPALRVGGEED
uniref:Uncharacterized protein n=1 Tax=Oryza brachyantha TaxID=4533 RepID=J3MN68_ORYBR